jgi:hypothetical protein
MRIFSYLTHCWVLRDRLRPLSATWASALFGGCPFARDQLIRMNHSHQWVGAGPELIFARILRTAQWTRASLWPS